MAPLVILLHGLARRGDSMRPMAKALERAGFETWSCDYPSLSRSPSDCAEFVARELRQAFPRRRRMSVVSHSLGGIVFRHLGDAGITWRRAVMLAPPNQGSALARALHDHPVAGRAFQFLAGTCASDLAGCGESWPYPPCVFSVIAGTRSFDLHNPTSWWSSRMLSEGENDGTVLVSETKLDGMAAFKTVEATHTTIMADPQVHRLAVRFLRRGCF